VGLTLVHNKSSRLGKVTLPVQAKKKKKRRRRKSAPKAELTLLAKMEHSFYSHLILVSNEIIEIN
jgi:hypothetical protein